MLSGGTRTYTWKQGRQLATLTQGSTTWTYTYDADGLRTKRTDGTNTYTYIYGGGKLTRMTAGSNTMSFLYDANGLPYRVNVNGMFYFYVTNLQGDVIAIVCEDGTLAVEYTYDAWGNILSITGPQADTIGTLNPLRYRSYIYDNETGLYYLQSRYYNPEIGRFISGDAQISDVGENPLGYNIFAYCFNNPVNMSDSSGNWPEWNTLLNGASLLAVGIMACAAAATVVSGGACAPLLVAAGAAFVAGGMTALNGTAEMVESVSGYNYIRDGVYKGDSEFYETQKAVFETTAEVGTAALGMISGSPYVCFVAGTMVLVSEGTKAIELITEGDCVWAWDEDSGKVELKSVIETYINKTNELVQIHANGEEIVTTPSHPFYSPVKGWTDAVQLRAGDILVLVNGEYVVVEKVQHELLESPVTVYNFQVEDYHTYYVTNVGVLVHNKCGPEFNQDQRELISLAKKYKRTGISKKDADALWELTEYTGLDKITNCHSPMLDRYMGGKQLHLKINGMHINIF